MTVKTPNKKMIGIFMLISISLFIGIILMFVGNKIFTKNDDLIVMYFEESIKGLSVGSSVSFRGVEIGKVSSIDLMANSNETDFIIPVYVRLNENQSFRGKNNKKIRNKDEFLKKLIENGLRARLTSQSYLTGQLMIELEMLPNTPIKLRGSTSLWNTLEIPTALSPLGELSKGLQDLPIRQAIDKFNTLFEMTNKELPLILRNIEQLTYNFNKMVSDNIGGASGTINSLNKTLNDISDTAKSLKNLSDYLERHPEALLKGKGRY